MATLFIFNYILYFCSHIPVRKENAMKTMVEMPQSILNDKSNWRYKDASYYMSGHMYRGTSMEAFETIDSCGNCDGASCDTCERREIPAGWELSVETDKLCKALINDGVHKDVAEDLAYNDFGCKTHWLKWDYDIPEEVLKELSSEE